MLFNLESDSVYESEMIKVKSRGINTTTCMCSSLKIRNVLFFSSTSKKCVDPVLCAIGIRRNMHRYSRFHPSFSETFRTMGIVVNISPYCI